LKKKAKKNAPMQKKTPFGAILFYIVLFQKEEVMSSQLSPARLYRRWLVVGLLSPPRDSTYGPNLI